MHKIIVADDNHLTIQALKVTVPWEEWGFQLVGCAENGVDALRQISLYHPDIAILDINMPGMTGLEVAKQLLEKKENIIFIFLTAYDEFSYAQTALKIGAFDYLLKPLDNEALKTVLKRAGEELNRKRQTAVMRSKLRSDYENWAGHLLQDSINGLTRSVTELEEMLQQEWRPAGYELMLVSSADFLSPERIEQLTDQIRQCLSGQEALYQFKYVHTRIKEGFLILLVFQKIQIVRDYDLAALKIANRIVDTGGALEADLFVGISDFSERSLAALPKLYEEAIFSAESRFFLENKTVIHYKSITSKSFRNEYMLSRKMQDMFRILYTEPWDFTNYLEEFIELILQETCYDVKYVKNIFMQIAFTITCSMQERNTGDCSLKSMETILEDMHKIDSMQSIISYIRTYTAQTIGRIQKENSQMSCQGRKVLDFINTHYMENITLYDVAEDAGISESHLCRVLKKETGESFVNILNKIRIQKAQKLLQKGDLKVYEIAEIVGFSNYAYFYQVFKKITGYSPKEYH